MRSLSAASNSSKRRFQKSVHRHLLSKCCTSTRSLDYETPSSVSCIPSYPQPWSFCFFILSSASTGGQEQTSTEIKTGRRTWALFNIIVPEVDLNAAVVA